MFVTEKAVSRWETGRGTPDISLLIPLAKSLDVDVSDILNGGYSIKDDNSLVKLIDYSEVRKKGNHNLEFFKFIGCYTISLFIFLIYLKFEYDPDIEVNYFIRLVLFLASSFFSLLGSKIVTDNYVEKLDDRKKLLKFSEIIILIYYLIFIFNMVFFARYQNFVSYNLIPFKTIIDIISKGSLYSIVISLFENLFVFMPLEYFIIELFKVDKFYINLIVSIFIVSLIEVSQFVFRNGVSDIDDVIIRVLGMMLFNFFYNKLKKFK